MLADVVSVARPGSSEGGSVPQLTVIVSPPLLDLLPLSEEPPHDAAAKASAMRSAVKPAPQPNFRVPELLIGNPPLSRWIYRSPIVLPRGVPHSVRPESGKRQVSVKAARVWPTLRSFR